MIVLENICKSYRTEEIETHAVHSVSFNVERGEFVSLMGPSGCGKSTLLNVLGLLDTPNSGSYVLQGTNTSRLSEAKRLALRKKHIAFIFQSFNLIDELTVYENVEMPLLYQGLTSSERKSRVERTLDRMDLTARKSHFPRQLSGGQQQRVAVARAVSTNPSLILADEPTGNLDSKNGHEVMKLLQQLNTEGTTILMVTHSESFAQLGSRIIRLLDGQLVD